MIFHVHHGQPTGHVGPSTHEGGAAGPAPTTRQHVWQGPQLGAQTGD